MFLARNYMYFRDYSIIFDGAYRISQGYAPYKDFGLPLGPISFYLPTLFIAIVPALDIVIESPVFNP